MLLFYPYPSLLPPTPLTSSINPSPILLIPLLCYDSLSSSIYIMPLFHMSPNHLPPIFHSSSPPSFHPSTSPCWPNSWASYPAWTGACRWLSWGPPSTASSPPVGLRSGSNGALGSPGWSCTAGPGGQGVHPPSLWSRLFSSRAPPLPWGRHPR